MFSILFVINKSYKSLLKKLQLLRALKKLFSKLKP